MLMTARTTAWYLCPALPVPSDAPSQGTVALPAHTANKKRQSLLEKKYSPKAFREMRWISNTDACWLLRVALLQHGVV